MAADGPELRPPDRRKMWNNLTLTMSQAAVLTGASERQIQHWMDRGYIAPASKGTRKVNGEGLDTIILIRQARASGTPLRQAVAASKQFLQREAAGAWEAGLQPAVVETLRQRMDLVKSQIEFVDILLTQISVPS